ncbi:MAG TPA: CHAT domain-containing tetratricopeptide repeat protein [Thermoanaerobaculia bacterium]|nr:CHAT domain-containing tetratricopeptide repeat protein [Thermoanaerobaculia bacterium]
MKAFLWIALFLYTWPAVSQEVGAEVLFRRGEYQKALEAYRTARQSFLAADDQLGQADTWRGEAEILLQLGEKQKALDACTNAQQLFRAARQRIPAGEPLALGHTWYGEAEVLFQLGETTKARYGYDKARQLYLAAGSKLDQGNTWQGEAGVLLRLGEDQKALEAYREARRLFKAAGDITAQGDTWLGEAQAWLAMARKTAAHSLFDMTNASDRRKAIVAMPLLGAGFQLEMANQANQRAKALKAATAAIESYQATGVVPDQVSARYLETAAEVWDQMFLDPVSNFLGLTRAPEHSAREVIRLHSQWRKTWITDSLRTRGEETFSKAYDFLVRLKARQRGQSAEALRLAEEARSRVLLDLLATPPDRGETASATDLTAERQRLETEIWQIEEQLRDAPKLDQQEELRKRRLQLDEALEWNRYQRIATQEESFPQEPPLDAAAIQNLARETGPLLVYYVAESEVWGFLILPETAEIRLRSIAISRSELAEKIRAFARDLANPLYERRAAAQAQGLRYLLIDPFIDRLPRSGPLVLVPHGPLHELPFEALHDAEGKRLFERWQISVTPSVSALVFARRRHAAPSPGDSFLGFSSGRGLSFPITEVAEISGFFGTNQTAFQPTAATYPNYRELVTQTHHLLIATRGVHIESSRSETYLEIDPTPEVHDRRLTAAEIATIPLQAELVTLAACDTSYGHALLNDERLDLTRSFLIARAAAVLATRWKVPEDEATSRFLADFYRAYRKGGPQGTGMRKDEALTEARRLSRERGDPAQVWAAWVLVGDAR